MSSPFEPRGRPSRRIGGYRGRKGALGVPGRSLMELASAPPIEPHLGLDRLDGRYLGPVNARSSSRGCGQLKVLDCAMVWMLVRRASPRSPTPCAMTRGIACSRIAPPSGYTRKWQQCQTSRRSRGNRKGGNHSDTAGNGVTARWSRRRSQTRGGHRSQPGVGDCFARYMSCDFVLIGQKE